MRCFENLAWSPQFGGSVVNLGAAPKLHRSRSWLATLTQMQTNVDRASSVRDIPPVPLPLRATPSSFVSTLVLLLVLVLVALIVWPR